MYNLFKEDSLKLDDYNYLIGQEREKNQFTYGYLRDGSNTCAVIAAYNASVALGESDPGIANIALSFELHGKAYPTS